MENKRFTIKNINGKVFFIYDTYLDKAIQNVATAKEIEFSCNALNELHEENQSLKKFIKELINE